MLTSMKTPSIVSGTCISFKNVLSHHLPPFQQLTLAIAVSCEASPQLVYNYPAITTYTLPLVYSMPVVYKDGVVAVLSCLRFCSAPVRPGQTSQLPGSQPNQLLPLVPSQTFALSKVSR